MFGKFNYFLSLTKINCHTFVPTTKVDTMKIEEILKTNKPLSEKKKLVINLLLTSNKAGAKVAEVLKSFDLSIQQFNFVKLKN